MAEAKLSQLRVLEWPKAVSIDLPFALFLIGLNGKVFYDALVALDVATVQPLEYFSFFLLWSSLGYSVISSRLSQLRPRYRVLFIATAVYLGVMFLMGLARNHGAYYFSQDIFALGYVSAVFIGARIASWRLFDRTMAAHFAIISLIACTQLFAHRSSLAYDAIIWSSLYLSWNLMYPWPYFLITGLAGPVWRVAVAIFGVALYVLLMVLFLKRTPVLMIGILFIVWVGSGLWRPQLARLKQRNILAMFSGAAAVAVLLVMFVSPAARDTLVASARDLPDRFTIGGSVSSAIEQDERFSEEWVTFRESMTPADYIFGKGIGATIDASSKVSSTGRTGVLHNGLANIVLKGGFVMLGLLAAGVILLVRDFGWIRNPHAYVCGGLALAALLVSPFQTVLNTSPAWAMYMACIGYLVSVSLRQNNRQSPVTARTSTE